VTVKKFQIPMTKLQRIPNDQAPNLIGVNLSWPLELGVWGFFGIWKLDIGILQTQG
jgi:hypothetical protein